MRCFAHVSHLSILNCSLPSSSWMQCGEGPLPCTSVTEVWRRGLAGEGARGAPTCIPRWEEDISGRYTGKCRDEAGMVPFGLPFSFSVEVVQPQKITSVATWDVSAKAAYGKGEPSFIGGHPSNHICRHHQDRCVPNPLSHDL